MGSAPYLVLVTLLASVIVADSANPVQHDVGSDLRVWACEGTAESFPSGRRTLLTRPGMDSWDTPPACQAMGSTPSSCAAGGPTVPDMSNTQTFGAIGVYLTCTDTSKILLSGYPGVVSECLNGEWTPVQDMCVDSCDPPRDCAWIAEGGYTDSSGTEYMVIPSGIPSDPAIKVKCELTSTAHASEGGWTLLVDQSTGEDYGENLTQWTWNPDGSERPIVVQFRMETVDGEQIHATYDNVVIDQNSNAILSLGMYYGNAGDALVPNVDSLWDCDPGTCQAVDFEGSAPFWGDHFIEQTAQVFFRPKDYDEPRTCPPFEMFGEIWDIPLSRAPGTAVTFRCRHWPMMEGPEGGTRVEGGTVTCVNDTSAARPQWERELHLPCTLECPPDFVLANNGTACFHFSTSEASFGSVEAARKCSEKNASLAIMKDPSDFSHLENGTYYYTAHTHVDSQNYPLDVDLEANFPCYSTFNCIWQGTPKCVIVTMDGGYKLTRCSNSFRYICMLPAWCPDSYSVFNGQCYKVIEADSDLPTALHTCNAEGSALAYPENLATMDFLKDLAKTSVPGLTEADFAIGINYQLDDPSLGGLYILSDDLLSLSNTSGDLATQSVLTGRLLTVDVSSDSWSLTPTDIFNETEYAICQYKGPIACSTYSPSFGNTTKAVSPTDLSIFQIATYSCNPGYFIYGERGNSTVQTLECLGQFGGWWPPESYIMPCYGVDVCFDEPAILPNMQIKNNQTFRYHTYGLTYSCNHYPTMSTVDGDQKQRYVCTEITNSTYNGTHEGDFNYTYSYKPDDELLQCNRCLAAPSIVHATHSFDSNSAYFIGDTLTATCKSSFLLAFQVTEQTMHCTPTGWNFTECKRVCLETPSIINATTDHQPDMWEVGEVVTATCLGDLYFADAQTQTRSVQCQWDGWAESPGCETVCREAPVIVNATVDWSDTRMRKVSEKVSATCNSGHGIVGARNQTVQEVTCTYQNWEQKPPCELLVCTDTPSVGNATFTPVWSPGLWLVGQELTADCLDGYYLLDNGTTKQTVRCTMDGWESKPSCIKACDDKPIFGPATSTWTSRLWLEGETVQATCDASHVNADGLTLQTVTCTVDGWQDPSVCVYVPPGAIVCLGEPEVSNAVTDWVAGTWLSGSAVNATCLPGHYALQDGSDVTLQTIQCTDDGWENKSACVRVCEGSPGDFGGADSDWENRKYQVNETVFATCLPMYFTANETVNQTVRCTDNGWETPSPCTIVQCTGPNVANSLEDFSSSIYNVTEQLVVTCQEGHFIRKDVQVQTLECDTNSTWGEVLPCVKACNDVPLVENANITFNDSKFWIVGEYVEATCYPEFRVAKSVFTHRVTCTQNGWDETTRCFVCLFFVCN